MFLTKVPHKINNTVLDMSYFTLLNVCVFGHWIKITLSRWIGFLSKFTSFIKGGTLIWGDTRSLLHRHICHKNISSPFTVVTVPCIGRSLIALETLISPLFGSFFRKVFSKVYMYWTEVLYSVIAWKLKEGKKKLSFNSYTA